MLASSVNNVTPSLDLPHVVEKYPSTRGSFLLPGELDLLVNVSMHEEIRGGAGFWCELRVILA